MGNEKMRDVFKIAAAAYLLYLSWQLLKGGVIDGTATGRTWYVSLVCGIAFALFAVGLIVWSVRHLISAEEEIQSAGEISDDEETVLTEEEPMTVSPEERVSEESASETDE